MFPSLRSLLLTASLLFVSNFQATAHGIAGNRLFIGTLAFDDPAVGFTTWYSHPTIASKTDNQDGNYAFPVTGIKLLINSGTGTYSATLNLVQAGIA